MISNKAVGQTLKKLRRFMTTLEERFFVPVGTVNDMRFYQTFDVLHEIPADDKFGPLPESGKWGEEWAYGWFKGSYTVPEELAGKTLYLRPLSGGYEATLWLNGRIHSNFATKEVVGSHGNHYCNRIVKSAAAGEKLDIVLEYYAYHRVPGTQPLVSEALPAIRRHMYAANEMNDILVETFGEDYSMIDQAQYESFESIINRYEQLLATGQSTAQTAEQLTECMEQFRIALSNRFTADGALLPKTASTASRQP